MKENHEIVLGNPTRAQRRDAFLDGRLVISSARGVGGADRVLLDAFDQEINGTALTVGSREGLAALATATLWPDTVVHNFDLDAYDSQRAAKTARANQLGRVHFHLEADLPHGDYDWILMPIPRQGDAMLNGELLRQAFESLRQRGKLLVATDNRKDKWLQDRIREIFGAVTIYRQTRRGKVYIARKQSGRAPRERDFRRTFPGRIFDQDLQLESRPGVFSHRRVDAGTKALAEVAEISTGATVVDLGCGSGALGIAAALANPSGRSVLVDSNARAVAAARANVVRNGVKNGVVLLAYDLGAIEPASVEIVLANPPYFGDFRILEAFARAAERVLKPAGTYYCVTKSPEVAVDICQRCFDRVELREQRGYVVLQCRNG